MKFFFALSLHFFLLHLLGCRCYDGCQWQLVFEPAEVTISAGESVHFINNMLPPHNVIVEDHPELGHEPGNDAW